MLVPCNVPVIDQVVMRSIQLAVDSYLRRSIHPQSDRDDLVQEVALHLLQQASGFNPMVGAWSTYVKCVVKSKLASLRRTARSSRHSQQATTLSLNQKTRDQEGRSGELGDFVMDGSSPACRNRDARSATILSFVHSAKL
jgi:DNA-directed RNA polymerase specialized sigma24 family protein